MSKGASKFLQKLSDETLEKYPPDHLVKEIMGAEDQKFMAKAEASFVYAPYIPEQLKEVKEDSNENTQEK